MTQHKLQMHALYTQLSDTGLKATDTTAQKLGQGPGLVSDPCEGLHMLEEWNSVAATGPAACKPYVGTVENNVVCSMQQLPAPGTARRCAVAHQPWGVR